MNPASQFMRGKTRLAGNPFLKETDCPTNLHLHAFASQASASGNVLCRAVPKGFESEAGFN